jgi:integrase
MDSILQPLSQEQLEILQKESTEIAISTISSEDLAALKKTLKQIKEENPGFDLTKRSKQEVDYSIAFRQQQRDQNLWLQDLEDTSVEIVIMHWISNLNTETANTYKYHMIDLMRRNVIPKVDANGMPFTIGLFRHVPHEANIDYLKTISEWSEATKQAKAACYISFTAYLERQTNGWFRKALPSTLGSNPTFFQVRDKCKTQALEMGDWYRFIDALDKINYRDALIAKTMFQGAKRISETLSITLDQLDFEKNIIRFRQKKTGGTIKDIPISYPKHFMDELSLYIKKTADKRKDSPLVFITNTGKALSRVRFNQCFSRAGIAAKIKFKVTPHVLRATYVTWAKQKNIQDSDVMKVTGHTSSKMIYAYDKTSLEDNISKKLILI